MTKQKTVRDENCFSVVMLYNIVKINYNYIPDKVTHYDMYVHILNIFFHIVFKPRAKKTPNIGSKKTIRD